MKSRASPVSKPSPDAFLYNVTRRVPLARTGRVLRGWRTGIGAMFRGLPGSLVLVWWRSTTIAVTNWFVPEALDIVWVDSSWRVASIREHFAPWAFHAVNDRPALYVVELPAGTVARTKTRIGDQLRCAEFATRA